MATPYRVVTAAATSRESACYRLEGVAGFRMMNGHLEGSGLTSVDVYHEDEVGRDVARDVVGFTPRLVVAMTPDKFDQYEQGLDSIARVLGAWLSAVPDDVALLFDDSVLGKRIGHRTTLAADSPFWTPERLTLLDRSLER